MKKHENECCNFCKQQTKSQNHKHSKRILLIILTLFLVIPFYGNSQSTCSNAIIHDSDTAVQYTVNDSVFWLKIYAESQNLEVFIIDTNTLHPATLDSLSLFSGGCEQLVLTKKSANRYLFANSINAGQNYYLKLKRSTTNIGYFSILINGLDSTYYNYAWIDSANCPPTPIGCECIPNNDFSIFPSTYNNALETNEIWGGIVCGWHALRATPGIYHPANNWIGPSAQLFLKDAIWTSLKNVQPNIEYYLDISIMNYTWSNCNVNCYLTNRDLMPYTLNHQLLISQTYFPLPFVNDLLIGNFETIGSTGSTIPFSDFRILTIPNNLINENLKLYIFQDTIGDNYIDRVSLKPLLRDTTHTCIATNGTTTLNITNATNQTIIWDDPSFNNTPTRSINAPGEYWAIVKHNDSCTVKRHLFIVTEANIEIQTSYCKPYMNFDCQLDGCNNVDHVDWNFGDGTNYTTPQGQTIATHQYLINGSYNVTATLYYTNSNSSVVASITQTGTANTDDTGNILGIIGNSNTCDSITSYSTLNSFTGTNCIWTISPANAGTIIANNNHTVTINWHDYTMTNGQPVTLTLNDGLCSKSINIWKCCKDATGVAPMLNDETITSNLSGGTYYLNGTITIDGNVTIAGVTFNMAQEAKIVLKAPTTFNINTSTIKAGCNYMWDGIYNTNSNSTVSTQASTIQDAQNAIVSENGGYVSASNTLFNLNYSGIVVSKSTVPNPLMVSNCKFYSTTDGTGTTPRYLIAPLETKRGSVGISANFVSNIQIGDVNKATKNKFSYTDYGIVVNNSSANIYNNNFINFPVYYPGGKGYGIEIIGNNNTARTVVIGGYNTGNNIYTNLFSNCNKGIDQQNAANIKVLCDTFATCTVSAAEISLNNYRNIDFTKNRIQNTVNGLLINDFVNTRLVVDSNSIYNVTNGITAQNATSQECYGATIRKNTITGAFKTGIKLSYVKGRSLIPIGPPGYERQIPYIYGNTITFGSYYLNGSDRYDGILIFYCYDTYIEDNIINTPTYTVANETQGLKLSGININTSPKTSLCSNTITNLGMGIRFIGLCTASPIKSNSMNNNYYGVRLENATIGNQGNPSTSIRWVNRNWWNTPFVAGRYRVQGSVATATTWTYDYSQITTNYTLLSSNSEYSVSGSFTSTAIISPVPQTCPGFDGVIWIPYSGGGGGGGDAMINGTQSGELSTMPTFTADIEENQYYQASAFYANAQTENLNMSVSEDAELTDNPIQTTSIPQFDQINKLISANRIDEAIAVNDAIVPKNLIEKNHKIANGIYLQSWAKGRLELTDDERATLLQIATQPHIQGGYGVITAWVMLNRVYRTESVKPKNIIKPFGIYNNETTIYPNPAREQVTVDGASEVFCVVIYDLQGRELIKTTNVPNSSKLTINTSKLTKGIYLITLIDKELSVIVSEKLVID